MNDLVTGAFPGTGPYVVTDMTDNEVRLGRNSHFRVWDTAVRPDGFPDEIVFTVINDDATRIAMVESGDADLTTYRGLLRTSPELFARIKTQYAGQWHVGSVTSTWIEMNSSIPPFNKIDARRAVNFAIDRAHMAELGGGLPDAAVTCQLLPPTWPGYRLYCPYTLDADEGGRWKAPNMQLAQDLIDSSGTRGLPLVVGPTWPQNAEELAYLASVLTELGFEVSMHPATTFDEVRETVNSPENPVTINGWVPDWVTPGNFLQLLKCGGDGHINNCDPEFDSHYDRALELQATDPAAALAEWATVDRRGVDLAALAPMYNDGADFVSARVGNYQYSPTGQILFDQMWVQ